MMTTVPVRRDRAPARSGGLRRAELQRDLRPIADLIEVCFAPRLDGGGQAVIGEMRALSRLGPALPLLARVDEMLGGIADGLVWEEEGRIIGNVTLIPARIPAELGPVTIIANVAVDPAYRRRGIARRLIEAALEAIRARGARAAILQVEAENEGARQLYEAAGFATERRWHEWRRGLHAFLPDPPAFVPPVEVRLPGEWEAEYALAAAVFPPERGGLGWQRPLHPREFRRSFFQQAADFVTGGGQERWIVRDGGRIGGALWVRSRFGSPVRITLIISEAQRGRLEEPLLYHALQRLEPGYVPALCEHPADHEAATAALERGGFTIRRTLDHMRLDL